MPYTFPKTEKLCNKSEIDALFKSGKAIQEFPIKLIFGYSSQEDVQLKAAFSVPKKKFKRAVDRNLLKRRMREAYRLNNSMLKKSLESKKPLNLFFIYLSHEKLQFRQIEDKIMLLLQRLEKIDEENTQ